MHHFKYLVVQIILITICLSCSSSSSSDDSDGEKSIKIISSPILNTDHNREYNYQVLASSTSGESIMFDVNIPSWLDFDNQSNTISGIADWNNVDSSFNISITATNDIESVTQDFTLNVQLGEIICSQNFGDYNTSSYKLPWNFGEQYLLSQGYCPSNVNWGHFNWFAYDFDMPIGTELLASRAGEVIGIKESNVDLPPGQADCSGGKENYVFILHSDGTVMSYVHLMQNGVNVNVGDIVNQGDIIGYSGNSGCSIGPHTHIALFRNRFNYDRQSTIPFNYSNAEGDLDSNNGLMQGGYFKAL